MGFNKRYLDKETIMSTLDTNGSISKLIDVDCLICDEWSDKFLKFYSKKYQLLRDKLNNDVKFSSNLTDTIEHKNFSKMNNIKNLSNMLENLIKDPSWTEVILVLNILNDSENNPNNGNFDKLREVSINKILNYFKVESRDIKIDKILS